MVLALLRLGLLHKRVLLFVNSIDVGFRLRLFLESFGLRAAVLNAELPVNSRHHILQVCCCLFCVWHRTAENFSHGPLGSCVSPAVMDTQTLSPAGMCSDPSAFCTASTFRAHSPVGFNSFPADDPGVMSLRRVVSYVHSLCSFDAQQFNRGLFDYLIATDAAAVPKQQQPAAEDAEGAEEQLAAAAAPAAKGKQPGSRKRLTPSDERDAEFSVTRCRSLARCFRHST